MTDQELAKKLAGLFKPVETYQPMNPTVVKALKEWFSRK